MVTLRQKSFVKLKLTSKGETHARSQICARDLVSIIDEPEARGGTNRGSSPENWHVIRPVNSVNSFKSTEEKL
jgi:hypothetical protein